LNKEFNNNFYVEKKTVGFYFFSKMFLKNYTRATGKRKKIVVSWKIYFPRSY